jgi:hypothetical protein
MLPSLLLAAALLPLQDAPAEPAPAPAQVAVPTETPAAVRTFLTDAEGRLYDPQAAGLSSLAFDVAIDLPQVGVVGSAHVTWSVDAGMDVAVTRNAGATLPPGLSPELADNYGQQMGMQLLGAMLNKPITPMLEGAVAVMDGVEDGLVKVRFHNAAASEQGLQEQALFFDEDGLLQRMRTVAEVEGPFGAMKVTQKQGFTWKPAAEGSELMVASTQTTEADFGMGSMKGESSFGYTTVESIVLATTVTTRQEMPMSPAMTQTLVATGLVVNGQPAAAPAAPEAAPADAPAGG